MRYAVAYADNGCDVELVIREANSPREAIIDTVSEPWRMSKELLNVGLPQNMDDIKEYFFNCDSSVEVVEID